MENYGLHLFEQNANTEASVAELESWKNESVFLYKMMNPLEIQSEAYIKDNN